MVNKINGCPKCKGECEAVKFSNHRKYFVFCKDCKYTSRLFNRKKDAIEAWNKGEAGCWGE